MIPVFGLQFAVNPETFKRFPTALFCKNRITPLVCASDKNTFYIIGFFVQQHINILNFGIWVGGRIIQCNTPGGKVMKNSFFYWLLTDARR